MDCGGLELFFFLVFRAAGLVAYHSLYLCSGGKAHRKSKNQGQYSFHNHGDV